MMQLRFVKREIAVNDLDVRYGTVQGNGTREVKVLQSRSTYPLRDISGQGSLCWSGWADVPLVEPEDE